MFNHMMHGDGLPEPDGVDAISGAAIDKYGPIHEYFGMTEDAFLSLSLDKQQFMTAEAKFYIDNYGDKTGWEYQAQRISHENKLAQIMQGQTRLDYFITNINIKLDIIANWLKIPTLVVPKHSLDIREQQRRMQEQKHQ
jgi:hypothetical protein